MVVMPRRIGPQLPGLSLVTEEQLEAAAVASEPGAIGGVPGTVPHLGELTEGELEKLSQLTESP
jgi:hypothetical protein